MLKDFYLRKSNKYRAECKICTNKDNSKRQKKNKLARNKYKATWLKEHPEKHKKWVKDNKGKVNSYTAKRRSALWDRIPNWLSNEQRFDISQYYIDASYLSHYTKVKFHVDHIIPLRGKDVSGLHVPWNLQIITSEENLAKGNKL